MNILFIIALMILMSFGASSVSAEPQSTPPGLRRQMIREIKEERKEIRKDLGILGKLRSSVAKILNGTVTGKSGTTLTVSKDGAAYTVNTDANTKFRRHFWGKSSIDEISVNDRVNVWGKFTDDAKQTILAGMIRNLSIMKRRGTFVGTVSDASGNSFTLNAPVRGAQKVTTDGSTKCVNRKEEAINCSDVKNGHRVRIKGMWDATNKTITEVTHLKDYSLPTRPAPSVTGAAEQ